jgi:hypothetical protein
MTDPHEQILAPAAKGRSLGLATRLAPSWRQASLDAVDQFQPLKQPTLCGVYRFRPRATSASGNAAG